MKHRSGPLGRRPRWRLIPLATAGLVAIAVAACGKTSNTSTTSAASTGAATSTTTGTTSTTETVATSGCGSVPTLPFKDASGIIKALPAEYAAAYNGFSEPIFKSAWSNFKPKHAAPYTVGLTVTEPINSFQASLISLIEHDLKAVKGVGKVTVLTSPPEGLTAQIQETNELIQQKVDLIVSEPLVPQAFAGLAAAAGKAGIPFISAINATPSPYAINLVENSVADGLATGAALGKLIGGTGTVIGMHGIPSTGLDQQEFAGWKQSLARCPNVKFDASLVGEFQVPVAKQQTLSYLSSHPAPIAGAVEAGGMGSGIIQAFQQVGRPLPAMVITAPTLGDLAYWSAHGSSFKAIAFGPPAPDVARAVAYTASMLLSGHGPKVSVITQTSPVITSANLSQWAVAGSSVTNPATANGPGNTFLPDSYLAPLFNK